MLMDWSIFYLSVSYLSSLHKPICNFLSFESMLALNEGGTGEILVTFAEIQAHFAYTLMNKDSDVH